MNNKKVRAIHDAAIEAAIAAQDAALDANANASEEDRLKAANDASREAYWSKVRELTPA